MLAPRPHSGGFALRHTITALSWPKVHCAACLVGSLVLSGASMKLPPRQKQLVPALRVFHRRGSSTLAVHASAAIGIGQIQR
eukprot:jgi/Chrpa1/25723/Chrysochromulina_OHIO_Genome00008977-RA